MEMKLTQGESIIKSWDYAKVKGEKKNNLKNLTITNKRVVASTKGKQGFQRQEFRVDHISGVASSYSYRYHYLAPLILWIVGLAVIVATFVFAEVVRAWVAEVYTLLPQLPALPDNSIPGYVVGGIVLLVALIVLLCSKTSYVAIVFYTAEPNMPLLSLASDEALLKGGTLNKRAKGFRFKVVVKAKIAEEMVNTVGSIILEMQNGGKVRDEFLKSICDEEEEEKEEKTEEQKEQKEEKEE